ncbi:MAG: endo-1,4-beta-xylanase [Treponema sp.]|jgi:endo-1,4-beta-xylanase|nr:endo-1,4-beta-xylanase [Treponema sp.]
MIKKVATLSIWLLSCVGAISVGFSTKDTFRSLALKKGIETGVAVAVSDLNKEAHINIIKENSSIVVAENCMKWQYIHPAENKWYWKDVDDLVKFAESNEMNVKFHTLFWHNQNPSFLSEKWSREKAIAVMDDHIATIMTRYKGRIKEYDVVNEMFDEDGSLRKTIWLNTIGEDYIEHALIKARECDPKAKLYLNDYSNETMGHPKADAMFNFVKKLKEKGVPIDGVGFQLHIDTAYGFDADRIRKNVKRYADIGVLVSFSEVDVRIPQKNFESHLAKQQKIYRDLLKIAVEEPNVPNFIMWGFTDAQSWVPYTFRGKGHALPYDEKLNPKPFYEEMLKDLKK